jgi:3-oxoacyl-[acyl-carrier-protein] synthase II
MGAGGAVELIISLLALQQGRIPPTAHCREPDAALGLDVVANGQRKSVIDTVMSNSFAFGGSNVVLIAGKLRI